MKISNELKSILNKIQENNGKGYLVGGCVRDYLLNLESKDIDIEVFGLSYQKLTDLLAEYGKVDIVGQSFGVIKLTTENDDYDFNLPRKDSKNGVGHKGFSVEVDSNISIEEAASRRDFTINSISYDPINDKFIDPYNGMNDLWTGYLVPTSTAFKEDVLRLLRAFQFSARFNLKAGVKLQMYAKDIIHEYNSLPKERIWEEWKKWASKGRAYSRSLETLYNIGLSKVYPEINAIFGIEQDIHFHAEGSVDIHTGLVLDQMGKVCELNNIEGDERLVLIFSALCHDFGKALCTEKVYKEKYGREVITSVGHEKKSGPLARSFLESIGCPERIIQKVVPIVQSHMVFSMLSDKAIRKLANRLFPATIKELCYLLYADQKGRKPIKKDLDYIAELCSKSASLGCLEGKQDPIIRGADIIELGYEPGPIIGKIQRKLYELQLRGSFNTREAGLKQVKNFVSQLV